VRGVARLPFCIGVDNLREQSMFKMGSHMSGDVFLIDKYVEVTSEHVNVNYDSHIETIYLVDVQSVKLSVERSKDWLKMRLLSIGINLVVLSVIVISMYQDHNLVWLGSLAILVSLLANGYLGKVLRNSIQCTLTLETTSGPVDILTSTDGLYLSKVRRAIKGALEARRAILEMA
jgi:hypothetical protein